MVQHSHQCQRQQQQQHHYHRLLLLPHIHQESWLVVVTTLALVLYGVLQERVMTKGWGPQQELFPYSSFLVLSNRLLTVLVLIAHSGLKGHTFIPVAPLRSYCLVSASNMVSTLCQYEALKYVSFVAQTLAKTAKALPVVLWGTLFGGKRYSARQYIHAILITGGCSTFVLGGDITSGSAIRDASWRSYAAGSVLLLAYLAADGWTSTQQEVLFKTHATPVREQLLYTTAFSTLYSLAATVASGQLLSALSFLQRNPDAALAVLTLSLASTVIQVCISSVLQRHGALMFALMMTSRQCVSVLLSTLLFGHSLSLAQWLGVAIAFSALYHQKTSGGAGGPHRERLARQPSMRSRLAISSGPKPPHARESDASQPLLDAVTHGGATTATAAAAATVGSAVGGQASRLAFRGSQAGVTATQSIIPAGHSHISFDVLSAAAAAAAGGTKGGVGGVSAAGAAPSPALMGPWRTASMYAGSHHDPHLIAVAEVQPMAPGLAGGVGQQVMHRHVTPRDGPGNPHAAGMALTFPGMKTLPPLPNMGAPAELTSSGSRQPSAAAAAGGCGEICPADAPVGTLLSIAEVPPPPGVPVGKSFDLRTLWSRGTGRVMVDPTTAVAMDHRDK